MRLRQEWKNVTEWRKQGRMIAGPKRMLVRVKRRKIRAQEIGSTFPKEAVEKFLGGAHPLANNLSQNFSGIGVGLRADHLDHIIKCSPDVEWFEVLADNYLMDGGMIFEKLDSIVSRYPIASHSVGLSLGGVDPLSADYLKRLKKFVTRYQPSIISDHLCWTGFGRHRLHELMPLPYTEEVVQHVVGRIKQVQQFLGEQIIIENVSSYLSYTHSTMTEWDFINRIAELSGCGILLDLNNVYVSSVNHNFSPEDYLNGIDKKQVKQYHLAGFSKQDNYLLDDHGAKVDANVWDLYRVALKKIGAFPTLIEWDNNIPSFEVLMEQAKLAKEIFNAHAKEIKESHAFS
jgi:uncharacterized protein (UPF0276 family)